VTLHPVFAHIRKHWRYWRLYQLGLRTAYYTPWYHLHGLATDFTVERFDLRASRSAGQIVALFQFLLARPRISRTVVAPGPDVGVGINATDDRKWHDDESGELLTIGRRARSGIEVFVRRLGPCGLVSQADTRK
jgi:hypothetical protein